MTCRLIKALEDIGLVLRGNANSGIRDRDFHKAIVNLASAKYDPSTGRSKFDGICHEVAENLLYALGINVEQRRRIRNILMKCHVRFERLRLQTRDYLLRQRAKVHSLESD